MVAFPAAAESAACAEEERVSGRISPAASNKLAVAESGPGSYGRPPSSSRSVSRRALLGISPFHSRQGLQENRLLPLSTDGPSFKNLTVSQQVII